MLGYPFDDSQVVDKFVVATALTHRPAAHVHPMLSGLAETIAGVPQRLVWLHRSVDGGPSFGSDGENAQIPGVFWRDARDLTLLMGVTALWKIAHLATSFGYSWNPVERNPLNGAVAVRATLEEAARFVIAADRIRNEFHAALCAGTTSRQLAEILVSLATGSGTGMQQVGPKASIAVSIERVKTLGHPGSTFLPHGDDGKAIYSRLSAVAHAEGRGRQVFRSSRYVGPDGTTGELLAAAAPAMSEADRIFGDCLDGLAVSAVLALAAWGMVQELSAAADALVPDDVEPSIYVPAGEGKIGDQVHFEQRGQWHHMVIG